MFNMNNKLIPTPPHKNSAFTLAEVLITLVIIGVIAAITIPTLITKYQKEQTVSRLKKVYSSLVQSMQRAIADNGPMNTWELGQNGTGEGSVDFANKYILPYLQISKNCETSNTGDCDYSFYFLSSTEPEPLNQNRTRFYLSDGTFITGVLLNTESDKRFIMLIDINGKRKPNRVGRDIFEFNYLIKYDGRTGKILPASYYAPRSYLLSSCSICCNKQTGSGAYCSAVIMKDSWQIKDDYPW